MKYLAGAIVGAILCCVFLASFMWGLNLNKRVTGIEQFLNKAIQDSQQRQTLPPNAKGEIK